jgi:hypothetical protein
MDLSVLLDPLDLPRLRKVLDELGHPGRLDTIRGWGRDTMAPLYEAAKGFKPVTLEDYVPSNVEPMREVIHHGKNSLPAFTHFQKRFCKPPAEGIAKDVLYGYNHNTPFLSGITGPGYYVAHASNWDASSEVDIDYTKLPPTKPETWPEIRPNERGVGNLVYGNMIDVMRGISTHVSIGRARKRKRGEFEWFDAWFVLCREDAAAN